MDAPRPFHPTFDIPGWDTEESRLEQDTSLTYDGETRPVRVLCVGKLFVYALYKGRFYALNGVAMRSGTKVHAKEGRLPVYDEPPLDLRMNAHALIPICDQ